MKRILSFVLCAVMLLSCVAVTSFAADDAVDAVISQIDAIGEVKYQVRTEADVKPSVKLTDLPGWDWSRPYFKSEDDFESGPWKLTMDFSFDSYTTGKDYVPNFGVTIANNYVGYRFDQQRWVIADGGTNYDIRNTLQPSEFGATKYDQVLMPGVVYNFTVEATDDWHIILYLDGVEVLNYREDSRTWQIAKNLCWFNSAYCTANIYSTNLYYDDADHIFTPAQIFAGEGKDPFAGQPFVYSFLGDKVTLEENTQTYTVIDSGEAITAAEDAYKALSDEQKAAVTNYGKLLAARATYNTYAGLDDFNVDEIIESAKVVTGGGKGRKYSLGECTQIPLGGNPDTTGNFFNKIIANGGDAEFEGKLLIEVTNTNDKRAGLHFGAFGQMYGYNAHYKNFYVGGNPFSDDGAGIPTGNNTVVVSPVEITENEWHTFKLKITAGGERTVSMWLDGELALKYTKCTDGAGTFYLDGRSLNMTWANITAKTGSETMTANPESTNVDDWFFANDGGALVDIPETVSYDLSKLLDLAKAYKVVSKSIAKVPAENTAEIANLDAVKEIGEKLLPYVDPAQLATDLDQQDIADAIVTAANADVLYNAFSDKAKVDALREALYMAQEGKFLNSWTTELSIAGWEEGKGEAAPVAAAAYGAVTFTYSTAADGEYSAEAPTAAGKYFVKATVAETKAYSGLESAPVEFEITAKSVTLGDLNNDGEVNAKDLIILIRVNAGWEIDYNNDAADMNADGSINMKDIILLINAIK